MEGITRRPTRKIPRSAHLARAAESAREEAAAPFVSAFDAALAAAGSDIDTVRVVSANTASFPAFCAAHPHAFQPLPTDPLAAYDACVRLADAGMRPVWVLNPATFTQLVWRLAEGPAPSVVFAIEGEGECDLAALRMIGDLTVADAADRRELGALVWSAVSATPMGGARVLRCTPAAAAEVSLFTTPLSESPGGAAVLRHGTGIALVALGAPTSACVRAADILVARGYDPLVVSARYLQPLDRATLADVARRCRFVVTVEDGRASVGFGAAVLEALGEADEAHARALLTRSLGAGADAVGVARAALALTGEEGAELDSVGPAPAEVARAVRVPTRVPVELHAGDDATAVGANLSASGMFLETDAPPARGTRVTVEFRPKASGARIEAEAEVMWVRDASEASPGNPAGCGIRFTRLDLESQDLLRDFVALTRAKLALGAVGGATPAPAALPAPLQVVDLDDLRAEMEQIEGLSFSSTLCAFIDGYSEVGSRNAFLWRWVYRGIVISSLPCVDPALTRHVYETKVLGVMFGMMLEDVARRGGGAFLDELLKVPFEREHVRCASLSQHELEYLSFAAEVWDALADRVATYPRHAEFRELLQFDQRQLLGAMRYTYLVQTNPALGNRAEHDLHAPHAMHFVASASVDLMASPKFDARELGALREILTHAQHMMRIADMVSTWERELGEGHWTSGIVAEGLSRGLIKADALATTSWESLAATLRDAGLEAHFLGEWARRRDRLTELATRVGSFDVTQLSRGLERLLRLHVGRMSGPRAR